MNRQPVTFRFFLAAAVCIFTFIGSPSGAGSGPLRIHFLDAGYGDATLIEFPDLTTMLIDAGDAAFASGLMDYLRKQRITAIDTAVLTHPHKNHFGGFGALSRQMPVRRVFTNGDPRAEEGYSEVLKVWRTRAFP